MSVKFTLHRSLKLDSRRLGQQIARRALEKIRARTKQGKGVGGRPFAPHAGRRAGERVDFREDGGLLTSLQVIRVVSTARGLVVEVGAVGRFADIAEYLHTGTRHMLPRPWLGLSHRELSRVVRRAIAESKALREVSGRS